MIHTIHGAVENWQSDLETHRLYVSKTKLELYLSTKSTKYHCFDNSNFNNDVLTVDDSTFAGREACKLARHYGHEVIFFINPWQILTRNFYFVNLLDFFIDCRTKNNISYDGNSFNLNSKQKRREFRNLVKNNLKATMPLDGLELVKEVSSLLGSSFNKIPDYLAPVTINDIKELHDIGVRIENHGWSHVEISRFSKRELEEDVSKTKLWIKDVIDFDSSLYAVPYGISQVSSEVINNNLKVFLSNSNLAYGNIEKDVYNRIDITKILNDL